MEKFEKDSAAKSPSSEPTAFAGWGGLGGAAIGLVIGLFTDHWFFWTVLVGSIGLIVGGLIDRSRR